MADREFTNINGIKVCDQTARNSIPTKTSQLTNDSGYITNIPDEYITEAELNAKGYATTSQIPTVPTNVSEFTNDANYASETYVTNKIAEAQLGGGSGEVDLSGYVTKETGNANQITFADGQTFQTKLDNGTLKGDKGDKGDTGPQGIQGPQGEKGDTGPQGEQGIQGEAGMQGEQGPAGIDGQTPNITIGTVSTLEAGTNATAEITGTTPNLTLNLGIPKGTNGQDGTVADADLSKLALNLNDKTLSLKNNGTNLSSVTLPEATVTNEQVSNAIQAKIDDGTLSNLTIADGSVTKEKLAPDALDDKLDKYTYIGGLKYSTYPFKEELVGTSLENYDSFSEGHAVEMDGIINTVYYPYFAESGEGTIFVIDKLGEGSFSIAKSYRFTVTGNTVDVSSLNISVTIGQYIVLSRAANKFGYHFIEGDSVHSGNSYYISSNAVDSFGTRIGYHDYKVNIVKDLGKSVTVLDELDQIKTDAAQIRTECNKLNQNYETLVYLNKEAEDTYKYPTDSEEIGSRIIMMDANFPYFIDIPIPEKGFVKYVQFKTVTKDCNFTLFIMTKENDTFKVKSIYKEIPLTVNNPKIDVSDYYDIKVEQGEYLGVHVPNGAYNEIGKLSSAGTNIYYLDNLSVGSTSYNRLHTNATIDTVFTICNGLYGEDVLIREKLKEVDASRLEIKEKLDNLENVINDLDYYNKLNIVHIGTSISDGKASECTWFAQAMKMMHCQTYTNAAESGRGAWYHAQNYDTLIRPYLDTADIFTIEHIVNDAAIGDVSNMDPGENGEYDKTTYYGAMAYIITEARKQNPFVKIGLMSHWNHKTIAKEITNVAEKFNLPILDVGKMLGGNSDQLVTATYVIGNQTITDTRTIARWYSTSKLYPNGDNLHPFHPIAQKKYAYMYANWIRSW